MLKLVSFKQMFYQLCRIETVWFMVGLLKIFSGFFFVAWLCGPVAPENASVPFLPVNPELSATRNQGRQKLARFSSSEFAALIVDILSDSRRRQMLGKDESRLILFKARLYCFLCFHSCYFLLFFFTPVASASTQFADAAKHRSELDDDDPLYDSVASDEDYITAEQLAKCLKVAVCMFFFFLIFGMLFFLILFFECEMVSLCLHCVSGVRKIQHSSVC